MKIQIGEVYMDKVSRQRTIYPNKTRKYLLPCLREYGAEFTNKVNNVFKVAVGIGDIIVSNRGKKHEKHIFMLIDTSIASAFFVEFIEWIREQPMYEDDYVYGDIQKSKFHMVILELPLQYYSAYETFKEGQYSRMYSKEFIEAFIQNEEVKKVLIKDHNYLIHFTEKVNRKYGTTLKPSDWDALPEMDFKPEKKTEVFNHHLER